MAKTEPKPATAAQALPATAAAEPDEFHGKGGSYVMENGVRRLVARTKTREEAAAEEAEEAAKAQAGQAPSGQA